MKLQIKNLFIITMLFFVTIGGTTSCSSKKKMAKKELSLSACGLLRDYVATLRLSTPDTFVEQSLHSECPLAPAGPLHKRQMPYIAVGKVAFYIKRWSCE